MEKEVWKGWREGKEGEGKEERKEERKAGRKEVHHPKDDLNSDVIF